MIIAVPTMENSLSSPVDERLGRANFFAIYDTDTEKVNFIENPGKDANSGAGIKAVQTLINNKVELLLAGHVGAKARDILDASGIKFKEGISGRLEDVLKNALEF